MHSPSVLEVRGLWVARGHRPVLRGLDLSLARGISAALIAPNGAGKTTLMEAIVGLIAVESGTIAVSGVALDNAPVCVRSRIGFMVPEASLPPGLTPAQFWGFCGQARRDARFDVKAAMLADRFGCGGDVHVPIAGLSFGTRQKIALVAALAVDADLFVLDEPFNGLDALAAQELQACLDELRDAGRTILASLHGIDRVARYFDIALQMVDGTVGLPVDLRAWRANGASCESIEAGLIESLHPPS